jgi:hypothetical protein
VTALPAMTPQTFALLVVCCTLMGAGLGVVLGHIVAMYARGLGFDPCRERPSSLPQERA